jgi:putative PIN family toxin of toxin-antitoxin system
MTRLLVIHAPDSSKPSYWRAGKRGLLSTPGRSSGRLRQWKVETALCRRCSTTIAAYPCIAIRCGRCCITSIVGPRMGRHRRRGFSGDRFPICLRACCHRSTSYRCQGSVVRPSWQVIEAAGCPGLSGYPTVETFDELQEVLRREKLHKRYQITEADVQSFLDNLVVSADFVSSLSQESLPLHSRDPKDDIFLACALSGGCDYLITGDEDLLILNGKPELGSLKIITASQFLQRKQ